MSMVGLYDCHTILSSAVLFSEMTPDPSWEAEFNDWYDREHIPLRMGAPGFRSAQRYRVARERHYLAVYELASLDALKTPAYQAIRSGASERTRRMLAGVTGFTRYLAALIADDRRPDLTADPLESSLLYSVMFAVPADREAEFDEWYARDHTPLLLDCRDWLAVRRFKIADGEPAAWTHLTLHHLADRRALDSPERARARSTPWRARLAQEPWFNGAYQVFERHGSRQLGSSPESSSKASGAAWT